MRFDINFGAHLKPDIFRKIRMRALRQYVLPYKIIDMKDIAKAFGVKLEDVEKDLAELITSGQIRAKIDSFKKILHARKENTQLQTYQNAKELGDHFIRDTETMLLKMALLQKDMVIKQPKGEGDPAKLRNKL